MAAMNQRRVLLGAVVGGVVWTIWSMAINAWLLARHYATAESAGFLLKQPRYPYFIVVWILALFVASYVLAWLYASVRATQGAGPRTALLVGLAVGFVAGFPSNFAMTSWGPFSRILPVGWTIDLWGGAVLAALVAGYLYKD